MSSSDALTRRAWLRRSALGMAGALGAGSLANLLLATKPAYAADYRALVCIFLYGGNDGMNTVVPTDAARHGQYAGVRGSLAIPRASLVPLSGTEYGLHPALAPLAPLWAAGQLAPVFNVGPLARPLTKAQYRAASAADVPGNLYSHSDQQVLWECAGADTLSRTGWGGRASELLATVNPVIALGGSGRFGLGSQHAPLVLPDPGDTFGTYGSDITWAPYVARNQALAAMYAQSEVAAADNRLMDALGTVHRDAVAQAARLAPIVQAQPGSDAAYAAIDAAFAGLVSNGEIGTAIGRQLYQVAKLVAGNATVQGNRQLFFAQMDGFDTHAGQVGSSGAAADVLAGTHATLLGQLGAAMAAFQNALNAIGLGGQVTTFTQSDFGRTFAPNSTLGTDHAWGNHQLVMGGAVQGSRTYGTYPELVLGGADDVGQQSWELQGRWIPTTSVDQYAATLLGWFGAGGSQLAGILPNLGSFSTANVGFV